MIEMAASISCRASTSSNMTRRFGNNLIAWAIDQRFQSAFQTLERTLKDNFDLP